MSIKYRIILLLTSLATLYVLITSQVLRMGVLPTFFALEQNFAEVDQDRVDQYFEGEMTRLISLADDWSIWTAAYNFMLGTNPDFVAENLTDVAQYSLHANIIGFIDLQGNIRWGGIYDLENEVPLALEEYIYLPLSESPFILNPKLNQEGAQGIANGPGPSIMFAARPIRSNSGDGQVAGTFLSGRLLDDYFLAEMEEQLSLDITFWDLNETLSDDIGDIYLSLFEGSEKYVQVEDDQEMRRFSLIRDVKGDPAFLTEVAFPRRIFDIGNDTLTTAVTLLVATLVLFMLVTWLLLDKMIIAPVRHLQTHIHRMREDEDLSQIIHLSRADEFGEMACEFNALTKKLLDSRQESDAARQEAEIARQEAEVARKNALAASESKSNFLATMSHEIRTPMNGVLGMAELLLSTPSLSREQKQYTRTISQSGGALLRILNDILDFSKIEAGKFNLEQCQFRLDEVAEDSIELVAHEAQRKGLELVLDLRPDIPGTYEGDAGRLRQMLLNLLSNAVKFTESGNVTLRVTIEASDQSKDVIFFEVEDTGIGIKAENQERLFNSFTQEDNSTTRRFGGTGLGLAVTRNLAELMGGEAGFSSTFGSGSKFWVRIPLKSMDIKVDVHKDRFKAFRAVLLLGEDASSRYLVRQLAYWGLQIKEANEFSQLDEYIEVNSASDTHDTTILFIDSKMLDSAVQKKMQELSEKYTSRQLRCVLLCPISDVMNQAELFDFGMPRVLYTPVRKDALAECFLGEKATVQSGGDNLANIEQRETNQSSRHHSRVLLAEDNKINVLVAEKMLRKLSYDVTTVANGKEAVDLCASQKFDYVLMDCSMPVMDGFEATQKIREAEVMNNSEKVTIIALTANAMIEDRERCLNAGMDDFLSKPISLQSLSESLRH